MFCELHSIFEKSLLSLNKDIFINEWNEDSSFPRKSSSIQIDVEVSWEVLIQDALSQSKVSRWQELSQTLDWENTKQLLEWCVWLWIRIAICISLEFLDLVLASKEVIDNI